MMVSKRNGYVYAIKHNPTGRIYVGSTVNIDGRIRQHMNALAANRHPIPQMQTDFNAYGSDYSIYILAEYIDPGRSLHKLEAAYMTILKTRNRETGYNYLDGTINFELKNCKEYFLPEATKDDSREMPNKEFLDNLSEKHRCIIEMWCDGASCSEIGKTIGLSRQRCCQIVKSIMSK